MGKGGGKGGMDDGAGSGFLQSMKRFDAFPKVSEDFFQRTLAGGTITLIASVVMIYLFFTELRLWLEVKTSYELTVVRRCKVEFGGPNS